MSAKPGSKAAADAATPKSAAEQWVVWTDYGPRCARLIKTTPSGFKHVGVFGGGERLVRGKPLFVGSRAAAERLAADLLASRKIADMDARANTDRRKERDAQALAEAIKADGASRQDETADDVPGMS